jgi:hypothetical protein
MNAKLQKMRSGDDEMIDERRRMFEKCRLKRAAWSFEGSFGSLQK